MPGGEFTFVIRVSGRFELLQKGLAFNVEPKRTGLRREVQNFIRSIRFEPVTIIGVVVVVVVAVVLEILFSSGVVSGRVT